MAESSTVMLVLWILFVFVFIRTETVFRCGPKHTCLCETKKGKTIMNCSGVEITLREVCSNLTRKIDTLEMCWCNESVLFRSKLQGCDHLSELVLKHCVISEIEDDTFVKMDKLKRLDLSFTKLKVYNSDVKGKFKHLWNLKQLRLNGIADVELGGAYPDLSNLSSLRDLYMDGIPNRKFPETWRELNSLRNVSMSGMEGHCKLGVIKNDTFASLKIITKLNISDCQIEGVFAGVFTELPNLENLDLYGNQMLGFETLVNISYGLQFTGIKYFNYSKVYSTFGIDTTLTKEHMCYLWNTSIEELSLDSNRIGLIEPNTALLFPPHTKIFHINDNTFTFGLYLFQFGCAGNVKEAYASNQHNNHNIFIYFKEPHSHSLHVQSPKSHCPFMTDDFLRNLSTTFHTCTYIEPNISSMPFPHVPASLEKAVFREGYIKYNIPALMFENNNISYIDFSGNILDSWTGPIKGFPKLKYLDLSDNYCQNISEFFFKFLPTIENLQISKNYIGLILNDVTKNHIFFQNLVDLKVLNLSMNYITELPDYLLKRQKKLEVLDLSHNGLQYYTYDPNILPNLIHLNLSFNSISALPGTLTSHFTSVLERKNISFSIDLTGNTLSCSCNNRKFLHWLVKYKGFCNNFKNYKFQTDDKIVTGHQLSLSLKNLDIQCPQYISLIVISSMCLTLFACVLIGRLIFIHRWKLRYLIHMAKRRYQGQQPLHPERPKQFQFDAFISYAEDDFRFIKDGVIPELEDRRGLELCIHQRDFLAGSAVADNIMNAIKTSRKTVVVLSKQYVKRKWCLYEFQMARMECLYSQNHKTLLVVMLEDLPMEDTPLEMIDWIQTESYLEYPDGDEGKAVFWDKLEDNINEN